MNQSQRPLRGGGGGGGGSVRRARERMEAGLPPEIPVPASSQTPPRQRGFDNTRQPQYSPSSQPRKLTPGNPSTSRMGAPGVGVAISRPTQVPQWPLAAPIQNVPTQADDVSP